MLTFWEQMGITIFQALLTDLHVNPAKLSTLTKVLTPIRDVLNSLIPPSPPTATA